MLSSALESRGLVGCRSFFGQFSASGFQAEFAFRATVDYFNTLPTSDVEFEVTML
jgi:hypothetical protein